MGEREGRSRKIIKYVVGCLQSVVGNKILLVQFKDGQKKDMSSFFIQYLYLKEEVEMNNPKSNLLKN